MDNSLTKLFDEMRAAKRMEGSIKEKREQLTRITETLNERDKKNARRKRILAETLRLHIHENMDVLQAKMIAPDNLDAEDSQRPTLNVSVVTGHPRWTLGTPGPELVVPTRAPKLTRWQRILAWLYKKLGGAA